MAFTRSGGILLHPTSLPNSFGIGDLGPAAHEFVDWLIAAGCQLWQVLPLGPTGYGNSPYQCFSAFAGNPYLISPEILLEEGLLTRAELDRGRAPKAPSRVDYGRVISRKMALLNKASERFQGGTRLPVREELANFRAANAEWLDDYALFMSLKEAHGGRSWLTWPDLIRRREVATLAAARKSLAASILRQSFFQFLFFRQWSALQEHAHTKGVMIVGDVPIFAAEDSADVWAHPELFQLDNNLRPSVVAGVPPDHFSPTGQIWGNPLYRWEVHRQTGYAWWLSKLRAAIKAADIVRLDHFRGFAAYWEIQAGNPTAEVGRWVPGPGVDFIDAIMRALQAESAEERLPMIAEDLGIMTPDVLALRDRYQMPGMKIMQAGFSDADDPFLPHNYPRNCVAYTGTHDNDTARGWFASARDEEAAFAQHYLKSNRRSFAWDLVRAIWSSVAIFAIAPMQDLLNLGTRARMNYPGRPQGNWEWRLLPDQLSAPLAARLHELNTLYAR